ncbi:MAG: hypothetical protein AB7O45_16620 [Alphaproteobacteria bacterium]
MADKPAADGAGVGRICGIVSIVCGVIAFAFVPILFGVVGVVLAILAVILSAPAQKRIGFIGLAVSVAGLIAGTWIGMLLVTG